VLAKMDRAHSPPAPAPTFEGCLYAGSFAEDYCRI
jgi:hypothetical protein